MKLFKSFIACFCTYSRIPMPVTSLDSDDMKYALCFFPFIGAVIGILEWVVFKITNIAQLPEMFRTLIMMVIPVIVTGGIHIDGFMDVMDAFNSFGSKEKKLEIMKDPHTGAFAVIYLLIYGMCYFAFAYILNEKSLIPFCLSFVISRTLSGISVVTIGGAKESGMIHSVKEKSENNTVMYALFIILIASLGTLFFVNKPAAILTASAALLGYVLYRGRCIKEFGGITGDTSGFYLCIMELVFLMIAAMEGFSWY